MAFTLLNNLKTNRAKVNLMREKDEMRKLDSDNLIIYKKEEAMPMNSQRMTTMSLRWNGIKKMGIELRAETTES